ncbi:MAG: element excision factor XisH family protein, partial [Chloroflexota bacterium]
LTHAGWEIIKEQYSFAVGQAPDDMRRLFIDIAAKSPVGQVVLIEVKSLSPSPVHEFMMLVGQYLVYQAALDFLGDDTPIYIAISERDYQTMIEHPLGQQVMKNTLRSPVPFMIYDSEKEEIVKWIPAR